MARSDLILNLIRSKVSGDEKLFKQSVEAMIAEEKSKQHHVLANQLSEALKTNAPVKEILNNIVSSQSTDLLLETVPQKRFEDLILSDAIVATCEEIVEEQFKTDLLRSYNLEPRHKLLLAGPPGNGKTSLAEALAESLGVPMLSVRYENIVTSFLGETNQKLSKLFDYVRTRRCVLFFDEFETISKERSDAHETGEIKRVVSSLLLQIDKLPSHVVTVVATNHPELLDRAVWRRFEVKLEMDNPSKSQITTWLTNFEKRCGIEFKRHKPIIAQRFEGKSFAEVEIFALSVLRKFVIRKPELSFDQVIINNLKLTDRKKSGKNIKCQKPTR